MKPGVPLFIAGRSGYAFYRIPVILALPGGRVIVFCEGRCGSSGDSGEIHIVSRISENEGETFGEQEIVIQEPGTTVGNPCPVFDHDTGRLWLFMNMNDGTISEQEIVNNPAKRRRVCSLYSDDAGKTWSKPLDMTGWLSKDTWAWYACGPCHGLQTASGRLVIPCDHSVYPFTDHGQYYSHIVYSDDHGKNWKLHDTEFGPDANECSVAEVACGHLYLNVRRHPCYDYKARAVSFSADGGDTWSALVSDNSLPDPGCQGSVINGPKAGDNGFYPLYLTNAADVNDRTNVTLRKSTDGAKTWTTVKTIKDNYTAYSDIAILEDGRVAWLYESGEKNGYECIKLVVT
jgi:sialidase-1